MAMISDEENNRNKANPRIVQLSNWTVLVYLDTSLLYEHSYAQWHRKEEGSLSLSHDIEGAGSGAGLLSGREDEEEEEGIIIDTGW